MWPCNHARWSAGTTIPYPTMGQAWREERRYLRSMSMWTPPVFTPTPKARISGLMGSFAVPHARTASVMASPSVTGLSTFTRRFVFHWLFFFFQKLEFKGEKMILMLFIQVRLRLSGVHTGWSGALRFGFTSLDPSELVATDIPKYACPDLVTRPGYWAKALPERLALKDNVLSFWADRHGRVFYSINEGEPILFHCGLSIGCPLWAIIDIYGITQEVTLLGKHFNLSLLI